MVLLVAVDRREAPEPLDRPSPDPSTIVLMRSPKGRRVAIAMDLEHRRPVWWALSILFLYTKLDEAELRRIADRLAQSPYDIPQLDAILFGEVYPVLISNLTLVATPEDLIFDDERLERSILARLRRPRWPSWLQVGRGVVRQDWQRVKELIVEIRASKDEERS